jgi:acyl-CoA synthetase (AMP-forming)/AMP-acid ligase II
LIAVIFTESLLFQGEQSRPGKQLQWVFWPTRIKVCHPVTVSLVIAECSGARGRAIVKDEMKMSAESELPLIARAKSHGERTAILDLEGVFTYRQLLDASARIAACLLDGAQDLREKRVAFLTPPGFEYAAVQWGVWRAGGIAVPLCVSHPRPELEHVILDADADIVVAHPAFMEILGSIAHEHGRRLLTTPAIRHAAEVALPRVDEDRRALILYTSGTTSKPKGVVTTHRNIAAQVTSLVSAWGWSSEDHILHVLPLHHIHGIINVLTCALWAGARCQMLPRFDAEEVWNRFIEDDLTLFMAVPTIYSRLIAAWEAAAPARQQAMSAVCARLRLMVSGSAALPVPVLKKWQEISGHVLLERYGMTEIGMGISNPLQGERMPGHVAGAEPAVDERFPRRVGLLPVLQEHSRPAHLDFARSLRCDLLPVLIHQPHLDAGQWSTDVSGHATAVERVRDAHADLRHAVPLQQHVPADRLPLLQHRHRQRRRAAHHQPQLPAGRSHRLPPVG